MGMGGLQNTVMCSAADAPASDRISEDYLFHDRQRIPVF